MYIFYSETTANNITKLGKIINSIVADVLVFFHVLDVTERRSVEEVVNIFYEAYVEWYLILKVCK